MVTIPKKGIAGIRLISENEAPASTSSDEGDTVFTDENSCNVSTVEKLLKDSSIVENSNGSWGVFSCYLLALSLKKKRKAGYDDFFYVVCKL